VRENVTEGVAVGVEEGGIEEWPARLSSQNHFMSRMFFKSILLDCWFNGSGNIVDEDIFAGVHPISSTPRCDVLAPQPRL